MELRSYQSEAITETYDWIRNNEGNCLVVVPTAGGKSLISAKIDQDAMQWENTRILNLTHVHELVSQNYKTLIRIWPDAPAGIYCAGLKKKQAHNRITFASIQSVFRKAEIIGFRDVIKIDEAHLISDDEDGMYRQFLSRMILINPNVRIVGLSATIFRTKSGYLHKGKNALFSGVAYEIPILRLVKEGWLCPLVSKVATTHGDTDKLAIQAGEFSIKEANTEFDRIEMTKEAVDEMIAKGGNRRTWLIFCVTIEHAEHVQQELESRGISSAVVTNKTSDFDRERIRREFNESKIKAVCNVAVWTTGLDVVPIDLIVLLRPTMSPGLLIQMLGRGMRPLYAVGSDMKTVEGRLAGIANSSKPDCLVLDMAGNLERHGPVTHIKPNEGERRNKKDREGKMCRSCQSINAFDATECIDCGKLFEGGAERKIKHSKKASIAEVMSEAPVINDMPQWFSVNKISYSIHKKAMSPDSLKVDYDCNPNHVSEWVCLGHAEGSFPRRKAAEWWVSRGGQIPAPVSATEAMDRIIELSGTKTRRIKAQKDGKYSRVISYDLATEPTIIEASSGNMISKYAVQR